MAMIPAVFATGETTTTRTYVFSMGAVGVTNGTTGASSIDDYNYNNMNNGWKYININEAAKLDISENYRVYQLQTACLRMCSHRVSSGVTQIAIEDGIQLALAIEKPSSAPGFYKATVNSKNTLSNGIQFYMGKWDGGYKSVDTYMTEKTKFDGEVKPVVDEEAELSGIVYNDGVNDFAFGIDTQTKTSYDFASLRLDELASPKIALSLDKTTLGVGETATASVEVTSDQVTQKLLNDYVTYESDNEDVAKVSELGEITTYKTGTATVTATVGGETYTQKINVVDLSGIKVEYDTYVGSNSTAASANLITYELWTSNGRVEYFTTTSTDELPAIWDQKMKEVEPKIYRFVADLELAANSDEYTAYKIRVPVAGDYMASLLYLAGQKTSRGTSSAKSGSMYILPYTADMDIASTISASTPVLSNVNFYDETNQFKTTEEVIFSAPNAGEYLMVWKNTGTEGTALTPVKLTLNGGTGKAPIWAKMMLENSELEVLGTTTLTSTVYTSDGKAATDTTGITYESTNNAVATISGTTVTAVGAGAAKIQAKSGNYILGEVDVTVTLPKAPTVSFYAESNVDECPIEITAKDVDNNAVEAAKAATLTRGADVTVNAPTYEGYTFRGWMRGTADGQVVSLENEYSFKAMTHTMLTAVYTEDDSKDEWYNFNGEFLGTSEPTEDPTLLGYKFLKTWREEVIDGITRHIAQFEKTTNTYNIALAEGITEKSKDEDANYYDTQVVLEAQDEVFWLRGGKVVDFGKTYSFNIWDATNITTAAAGYDKSLPMVYLDSAKGTSRMIEYDKGAYEIVEVGILFGEAGDKLTVDSSYEKATSQWKKAHGQFTAKPTKDSYTNARGYLIYKDGNDYKVIYAD
ncbi:MAG: Ig-like domain-containing protein, partial [Oscillospiraceae bacterium]|nr:Ig-like domain-containing protein [Oscillospiraceae bacterium]